MDDLNIKYFFVCQNSEDNKKYIVCPECSITQHYDNIVKGQYISSLQYQSLHSIHDSLRYYIVKVKNVINARKKLQELCNTNIKMINKNVLEIYEFSVSPSKIQYLFETCKARLHQNDVSRERDILKCSSKLSNKTCYLSLCVFVTRERMNENKIIINNPSFTIKHK